jgi:hypothetical protein
MPIANTARALVSVALACLSGSLFAQDKLVSTLIPTGPNAEVYDISGKGPESVKGLAEQLSKPILSLGGAPTYDMREVVEGMGVKLGAGDTVLYSADSRLLYARSSKENIEII